MKHLILLILFISSCTTQDFNDRNVKNSVKQPAFVGETPEGCKIYTAIVGGYTTNIIVCKEPYNASISR